MYLCGVMRRALDGRFKVVFFATTLPPLKVVTVTLLTGFLTAFALGASKTAWTSLITLLVLAVCEVLRVLRFFGAIAFGVAGVFDLTVINSLGCVYSYSIPNKKPLLRGLLHTLIKKSSLLTDLYLCFDLYTLKDFNALDRFGICVKTHVPVF